MAQQPHRPFESLEWYRNAARNNFREDGQRGILARWASGFGMLHAHACVFAVLVVVMFLVNLLRTPESIWADKWIMAWTVLILIHAVIIGILWAVHQWNSDAPDEALLMTSSRNGWQQSPMFAWGERGTDAQEVDFRVSGNDAATESIDDQTDAPGWMGWNADEPEPVAPESNRASWREASAAAWLDRSARSPNPQATDSEAKPDA